MSTQYAFGKIVTNGLVLALDAADRNSYVSGSTTWFDLSGNNYTGSLTNGPTYTGSNGGFINFDGVNDYIVLGPILNYTSENFSFSYWVNFNSFTTNRGGQGPVVIYKGSYSANGYYDQMGSNGSITFVSNQPAAAVTSTGAGVIATGSWYNVAHVRNGTSVRIYVNGVDQTQTSGSHGTINGNSTNFTVATYAFGYICGNLKLSSMLTYNRALSQQEVLQNYNAQKARFGL
jgi:hypothetical protein